MQTLIIGQDATGLAMAALLLDWGHGVELVGLDPERQAAVAQEIGADGGTDPGSETGPDFGPDTDTGPATGAETAQPAAWPCPAPSRPRGLLAAIDPDLPRRLTRGLVEGRLRLATPKSVQPGVADAVFLTGGLAERAALFDLLPLLQDGALTVVLARPASVAPAGESAIQLMATLQAQAHGMGRWLHPACFAPFLRPGLAVVDLVTAEHYLFGLEADGAARRLRALLPEALADRLVLTEPQIAEIVGLHAARAAEAWGADWQQRAPEAQDLVRQLEGAWIGKAANPPAPAGRGLAQGLLALVQPRRTQ